MVQKLKFNRWLIIAIFVYVFIIAYGIVRTPNCIEFLEVTELYKVHNDYFVVVGINKISYLTKARYINHNKNTIQVCTTMKPLIGNETITAF